MQAAPGERNSIFITTVQATGALPSIVSDHARQCSYSLNCCDEEGISPGSPYIQMRPAEIPFSIQLVKDTGALPSSSDGQPL